MNNKVRKIISLAMIFILFLFFSLSSDYFLSYNNILTILRDASVPGIIGIGVTYVIIIAGIDLSTGAMLGLIGMVIANIYAYTNLPIFVIYIVSLLVGLLCGYFNGFLITKLKLPEFIATLSTLSIFKAITYIIATRKNGNITSTPIRDIGITILDKNINGVYIVVIIFLILAIIGDIILKKTTFGTSVYSIGSNKKASILSGINIEKTQIMSYMIVGMLTAIACLFTVARLQSASVTFGEGLEFNVIAAVVVGGTALSGGKGDIIGTVLGVIFMSTLDNGIYKFQISTAYQSIIKGAIILLVIIFDSWYSKKSLKNNNKEKFEIEGADNE